MVEINTFIYIKLSVHREFKVTGEKEATDKVKCKVQDPGGCVSQSVQQILLVLKPPEDYFFLNQISMPHPTFQIKNSWR